MRGAGGPVGFHRVLDLDAHARQNARAVAHARPCFALDAGEVRSVEGLFDLFGRALVQAMLRQGQLTRNVTVPVSAGLLVDTEAYFAALTVFREGDPSAIVNQFATAAFRAVVNGRELVEELRRLRHAWAQVISARRDSAIWRVCDLLVRRPVVHAKLVAQELGIAVGNVHRYIDPLLEAGVVVASRDVKRNQIWRAPEVLTALDAFAARAGRRAAGR